MEPEAVAELSSLTAPEIASTPGMYWYASSGFGLFCLETQNLCVLRKTFPDSLCAPRHLVESTPRLKGRKAETLKAVYRDKEQNGAHLECSAAKRGGDFESIRKVAIFL